MKFNSKIVWITGASNGIGRQLAIDLAKKNCKLILSSRNQENLEITKRECQAFTPEVRILPLDLSDIDSLNEKARMAIEMFGGLRMEHEKDGIKVTIVCPGFVNTDITRNGLVGDGSEFGQQDPLTEQGLRIDDFSTKMIKAVERGKFEAYIGGKEAFAVYVKRFFPKLLHKIVMNSRVR